MSDYGHMTRAMQDRESLAVVIRAYCKDRYYPLQRDFPKMVTAARRYYVEGWSLNEAAELAVEDWAAAICFKYSHA